MHIRTYSVPTHLPTLGVSSHSSEDAIEAEISNDAG